MELKYVTLCLGLNIEFCLNRTFMELKYRDDIATNIQNMFKSHLYGIEI